MTWSRCLRHLASCCCKGDLNCSFRRPGSEDGREELPPPVERPTSIDCPLAALAPGSASAAARAMRRAGDIAPDEDREGDIPPEDGLLRALTGDGEAVALW